MWKKLRGYEEKLLSNPRKEIILKAVAQAIPIYVMSIFRLPETLLNEIHAILAKFWWGSSDQKKENPLEKIRRLMSTQNDEGNGI